MLQISKIGTIFALTALVATFFGTQHLQVALKTNSASSLAVESLPMAFGQWQGREEAELSQAHHNTLKLDRYVRRTYSSNTSQLAPELEASTRSNPTTSSNPAEVFVYVGYWRHQSSEHQAAKHSPLMCLPANGWKVSPTAEQTLKISPNLSQPYRQISATLKGEETLFNYWFFSGDRIYTDEGFAIFYIIKEVFLNSRSDGGIVEISTPIRRSASRATALANAQATLDEFMREFVPELSRIPHELAKTN